MRDRIAPPPALDRGAFLRTGAGLVVACGLPALAPAAASATTEPTDGLRPPYGPVSPASLDSWLAVKPNGSVLVFTGRNDSGQGKQTAFAQVIADELDVAFGAVTVVMADTARTPDQGGSFASDGLLHGVVPLRHAAAEARLFLVRRAAERLGSPADELVVKDAVVSVRGNAAKRVTYAQLIGGQRFDVALKVIGAGQHIDVVGDAQLKPVGAYRIVGNSIPRTDIPAKVTAQFPFVHSVRLPGMLHGRVVAPPAYGATLVSLGSLKRPIDGVLKIVRKGNFVGVVAISEWAAIEAARAIETTWTEPANLITGDLFAAMRTMPTQSEVDIEPARGDVAAAFAGAAKQHAASYHFPIQNHGMMGPSCAVVDVRSDEVVIHSGTQYPAVTRGHIAKMLNVPLENVRLIWYQASGCYGRMTMDDTASAAALLSAEVGKPVRVQFMREDEHVWEPHVAPFSFDLRAALDANGRVVGWNQDGWTWGLGPQAELPWILEGSAPPNPGRFAFAKIGGGDAPVYNFPNVRAVGHPIAKPMVRSIDMRSPGHIQANFACESFMDELAALAGMDPIAFRLPHLSQLRAADALRAAAQLASWQPRSGPGPDARRAARIARGRGISFVSGQKESFIATVAEVEVDRQTGVVRPLRMFVAADAGIIVNPDGMRNQIEGATLFGTSRALKEEVHWNPSAVTSIDWETYPILRMSEAPEVHVTLINRTDAVPGGIGESPNTTPSAAIANAIFDATGARVRQVPFTPSRVKAALAQA